MSRPPASPRRWLLPSLLVVSLGLNGYFLVQESSQAQGRAASRGAPATSASPAASLPRRDPEVRRLRQQLRLCRLQSWQLVMQQVGHRKAAADKRDEVAPDASAYAAQREALCGIGLKQLRRNWTRGRQMIAANLARDLADPAKQEKDVQRFADDLDVLLNLSGRQRSQLEDGYRPIRERRVRNALAALRADPPDYEAVLDEAMSLYEEEDGLLRSLFGDEGLHRARDSRLEQRTAVIAILAAMADVPWNKELAW